MTKLSRLSWRKVLFVLLSVLIASWLGLQTSQWLFRIRAERLLADIKSLQVNHSSWSDAQKLMDRWGKWGDWYGSCTPEDCRYAILLPHLSLVYPDFQLEEGPHLGARILEFVGCRSGAISAKFHVVHGIVAEKEFSISVALPVSRWITPGDSFWLREQNGISYWPTLDVAAFEGMKIHGASSFTIEKNPYRGFVQRRTTLEASFTPEEEPAEKAALMDFHFDCLTRLAACISRGDLLPRAAEEFEDGGSYPNK